MIDFFVITFLIAIIGVVVFLILSIFIDNELPSTLAVLCLLIAIGSGIGMEVEKVKEPNVCECKCSCCSFYETE